MIGKRASQGGAVVYTLAELVADPELEKKSKETVVPFIAWAERVTLLAAREKDGKSTFVGAAAASLSAGCDFLGCAVKQRPVLWVGLEEHAAEVVDRLVAFGANRQWVFVMTSAANPLDDLEDAVAQLLDVGVPAPLVVIDTLGALVGGEVEDAGSSTQWTPVMQRLTKLARIDGASVLILHHARKSDGEYRDSTAIGANVDMILRFSSSSGRQRTISGKGRWHHEEFTVELRNGSFALVSGGKPLEEWVVEFAEAQPGCSLRQVREGVVGANSAIDDVVRKLLAEGRLLNEGVASGYSLRVARSMECAANRNP